MNQGVKPNETYSFIEKAALMLSEVSNTPLTDFDHEMLQQVRKITDTNEVYLRVLKAKNYTEEIESHSLIFENTPHVGISPQLKLSDKNLKKRYYDLVLALKVCNENVLQKSMGILQTKGLPEHISRQSSIISLTQPMPLQANDDPHFNFNYALPFRWLVWSLKQLKLPTPSKFTDFEKLYSSIKNQHFEQLIHEVRVTTETVHLNTSIFNNYHTENVLYAFVMVLNHFSGKKLEQLSDDEYNALSSAMYGYACICRSDIFFYSLTGCIAPDFMPLIVQYLRTKAMRSTFLSVGDNSATRGQLLNLVALVRTLGARHLDFINNVYENEPEEFIDFVHSIAPIFSSLKESLNHPSNIVGKLNVYNTYEIFSPIVDGLNQVLDITKLFNDLKVSKAIFDKLSDFEALGTKLVNRLKAELDTAYELYNDERFFNATSGIKDFIDARYDTLDPFKIVPEFSRAIDDLGGHKSRSVNLIEDGQHDLAIEELKQVSTVESQILNALDSAILDLNDTLIFVATVFDPIHEAVAQAKRIKADEEAAQESMLDNSTAPVIALKAHQELMDLHEQNMIAQDSQILGLRQELTKLESELVAANNAKQKLLVQHSGPSKALRNLINDSLSIDDVLTLIKEQFPQVEYSDNFNSHVKNCNFQMPRKLLKHLFLLCDDYYNAIIDGKPDSLARDIIGQCYRANESDTTLNNAVLRAHREFSFRGQKKLFIRHLTIGGVYDNRKTVQVYFDIVGTTLQIAYVGEHLPLSE